MNQPRLLITATLALVFLTACGSAGGLGDILGGGGTPAGQTVEVRGTVESVDTNSRSVILTNVTGINQSMLSSGNTVRVYYDDQTPVYYNNQTYRPQDLERGDQIAARVDQSGNSLKAESMTVTYNVASGSGSGSTSYETAVRGTVRNVDTSRRSIEVARSNGTVVNVEYDTQTPVYYNNQTYRVADLERGDEVDIRVRSLGSGRYAAEQISVIRSVSGGTSGSSQMNTIRGTVVYVDTSRRTIELESTSWRSSFDTGTGSGSGRTVVSYDANTSVDVSGRLYPVSGLERGDVIDVQVQNPSASIPFATRILLVRDASPN